MDQKQVFTTGEVANLLHIHQTTIIDWAKKGLVKSYRTPGGHRRIVRAELLAFLHTHKMPIPDEMEHHIKPAEAPKLGEHRRPMKIK